MYNGAYRIKAKFYVIRCAHTNKEKISNKRNINTENKEREAIRRRAKKSKHTLITFFFFFFRIAQQNAIPSPQLNKAMSSMLTEKKKQCKEKQKMQKIKEKINKQTINTRNKQKKINTETTLK